MIANIPTNIITGFLGVGKTTAIQSLLKDKPAGERWAVLVNEFGEVGIDGALIAGNTAQQQGIFIREVPGGCMCCTAGLPMQMALTMLLAKAKPDRLLIEPTGLGHPQEVLSTLLADNYKDVLDLCATITLVDARKISDERYTGNDTFNQQLAIADVIVANKADLYDQHDLAQLNRYVNNSNELQNKPLYDVEQGLISAEWLLLPNGFSGHVHHHAPPDDGLISVLPANPQIPDSGYLRIDSKGSGFFSSGWLFDERFIFDGDALYSHLLGISAERLKAVFKTNNGIMGFNHVDGVLSVIELDEALDSRIEVIGPDAACWVDLEIALKSCLIKQHPLSV
jgi:G3E family GTPase